MKNALKFRLLIFVMPCFICTACGTTLYATHEPMHPVSGYVLLKAEAEGSIDRIELHVQRFSIDPVTGDETADSTQNLVATCDPFLFVSKLRCWYRQAYSGNHKMIEFEARAVLWNGGTRSEKYKFASGEYPSTGPFEGKPVPIRVKGPTQSSLDIVIVPDSDLLNDIYSWSLNPDGDWDGFRAFLDDIVDDLYFDYKAVRNWRGLYNFYYSREDVDYNEADCTFEVPTNLDVLEVVADALMYAHSQEMWDCTLIDKFSTENWYGKSVLHESGHALIDLRDEYAGARYDWFPPHKCMSNIFPSKDDCEAEAPDIGLPANFCTLADATFGVWRIDPADAQGSIMGSAQHYGWSDFGRASMRRINWRYEKCLDGDCMAPDECDEPVDDFP